MKRDEVHISPSSMGWPGLLLHESVELVPLSFAPHLKPLRLVCRELKKLCCLVADEIINVRRTRALHTSVKAPIDQRGTRFRPIFDRRQKCLGSLAWSALLKQPCAL